MAETHLYRIELPAQWQFAVDYDHLQAGSPHGQDIFEIIMHTCAASGPEQTRHWLGVLLQTALQQMIEAARDPQLTPTPRPQPRTLTDGSVMYEILSYTRENDFFFYQCCRTGPMAVLHALYQGPKNLESQISAVRHALENVQWKTPVGVLSV